MTGLGNLLHETTHVSRPLVPTVLIHTGPQIHSRDGHFVAGERPVRDRFRMAQTFWAGHRPLLLKEMWRRVPLDEKDGTSKIPSFERGVVFDRRSQTHTNKGGQAMAPRRRGGIGRTPLLIVGCDTIREDAVRPIRGFLPRRSLTYRMRLMGKFQLKNTAQLTRYAFSMSPT